ncbi:MAG: SRPBCC family protein [Thermosynechococcaceae cyanobacterium]
MLHFEKSCIVAAPVATVWQFHERPDILTLLTPPWQPVQIIRREGGLEVGALSEFRIWLGPFPVQWISVHTSCVTNQQFTDEQQTGPMAAWTHRHQFDAQGDQTRLTDAIDFEIPGGEPSELILGEWVKARLNDMFAYRHQVTQAHCTHEQ